MEIQALQRKAKPVIIPSKKLRRGFHEGQHAHVQSILRGNRIQPKLKLGQPNDKYENEADRVAEQVMRMPASQSSSIDGTSPGVGDSNSGTIQRACAACASDEELIQIKTNGHVTPEVTPAIGADIQLLQSGGQPLSRSERSFFEPRIGANFSNVRVHNYTKANNVARSINARAFTHGHNVVFGAGEYSPNTASGKKLLAHELTHVVQQSGESASVSMNRNSGSTISNVVNSNIVSPKLFEFSQGGSCTECAMEAELPVNGGTPADVHGEEVVELVTGGSSKCNLSGDSQVITNNNDECSRSCTQEHEENHVANRSSCCEQARTAYHAARDSGDAAARRQVMSRWNQWVRTNKDASECAAYAVSISCVNNLISENNCSSEATPSTCCEQLSSYLSHVTERKGHYCGRSGDSTDRTDCPSFT